MVDLLGLVLAWKQIAHHIQEPDMAISIEWWIDW